MVAKIRAGIPVAVGGIGGSGTRLVADILLRLGFFLGSDLNASQDNLWFTLLFKRLEILECSDAEFQTCVDLFVKRMQGVAPLNATDRAFLNRLVDLDRPEFDAAWGRERLASIGTPAVDPPVADPWGWKEPNTHIVLPRLMRSIPTLKYIHVLRNGLDMAYSGNQNQLRLWGSRMLGLDQVPIDPRHALKYWCRVHERILGVADQHPDRCLLLNFDALCAEPRPNLIRMLRFLDARPNPGRLDDLASLIKPPGSIGRFQMHDPAEFDPEDIRFAAKLGFSVDLRTPDSTSAASDLAEPRPEPPPRRCRDDNPPDQRAFGRSRSETVPDRSNAERALKVGGADADGMMQTFRRVSTTDGNRREEPKGNPRGRRTALLVLGMHRSGTSAFTRVAGLLGATLPRDLMPPVKDNNEAGFWESMGIYQLNDRILTSAGTRWNDWRGVPVDRLDSSLVQGFKARARAVIQDAYGVGAFIVVKDPRICRLIPFWREVLDEMGMDILALLPVRNPLEVAASLRRRDGLDPTTSYLSWLRHTLDAEAETRGIRRSIITFDQLMLDWRHCATHIQNQLRATWPNTSREQTAGAIDAFLNDDLRHNRAIDQDLYDDPTVPRWVKSTFRAMLELVHQPDSPSTLAVLDGIKAEFDHATQAIEPALQLAEMKIEQLSHRIDVGNTTADRLLARIGALESALTRHRTESEDLRREIMASENRVSELEAAIARDRSLNDDLRRKLEAMKIQGRRCTGTVAEQRSRMRHLENRLTGIQCRADGLEEQRDQLAYRLNALHSSATWQVSHYLLAAEQRFPRMFRALLTPPKLIAWILTMQVSDRMRLRAEVRRIQASRLFDEAWYVSSYPEILAAGYRGTIHWSLIGWKKGLWPNPLFETRWYLEQNPDVRAAGIDPLIHYDTQGAFEGRDPHPHFSSRWYLEQNPDVARSKVNPLAHFLETGAFERRDPNPSFQISRYLAEHPEIAATDVNPLVHYLRHRDGKEGMRRK